MAARLLFVASLFIDGFADSLSVGYLRYRKGNFNAEFIFKSCNNRVKVLFAEALDNLLFCFFVCIEFKSAVLFGKSCKTRSDFILFALFNNVNSHCIAGKREVNAFKGYGVFGVAHGVARFKARKFCNNAYIAGGDAGNILLFCAPDGNKLAHFFNFFGSCVISRRVGCDFARNNLKERHLAYEGVGNRLKADSRKRSVRLALKAFFALGCGSKLCNSVKNKVNSVKVIARASVNGNNRSVKNAL